MFPTESQKALFAIFKLKITIPAESGIHHPIYYISGKAGLIDDSEEKTVLYCRAFVIIVGIVQAYWFLLLSIADYALSLVWFNHKHVVHTVQPYEFPKYWPDTQYDTVMMFHVVEWLEFVIKKKKSQTTNLKVDDSIPMSAARLVWTFTAVYNWQRFKGQLLTDYMAMWCGRLSINCLMLKTRLFRIIHDRKHNYSISNTT